MVKSKTTENNNNVYNFINSYVNDEKKREDSFKLVQLMQEWSGFEPKMWGETIIGFGNYHYKYDSGHEGDSPLISFSPRKSEFSLYVYSLTEENNKHLEELGKFRIGKACIYVKKLSDINLLILEKISKQTIDYIKKHNQCSCKEK